MTLSSKTKNKLTWSAPRIVTLAAKGAGKDGTASINEASPGNSSHFEIAEAVHLSPVLPGCGVQNSVVANVANSGLDPIGAGCDVGPS